MRRKSCALGQAYERNKVAGLGNAIIFLSPVSMRRRPLSSRREILESLEQKREVR